MKGWIKFITSTVTVSSTWILYILDSALKNVNVSTMIHVHVSLYNNIFFIIKHRKFTTMGDNNMND